MKTPNLLLATALALLAAAVPALATTYYVWPDSPSPGSPYADWSTAAHTIQDAVDAAGPGDQIVVTNGVYSTGGRALVGSMTNRVAVTNALTLRSVNGPQFTFIQGYQVPGTTNGNGAIRCVYLTNGAVLDGFTLTNGATRTSGNVTWEQNGGGVCCASTNALITNCLFIANAAARFGGGAYSGTLANSTLTGNSAQSGGGAYSATLNNCTLTANSASSSGGGAYNATLRNCILYYNTAGSSSNYVGGTLNFCCTTPLPGTGTGNISAEPKLASASHLSDGSPCRGAGSAAYATGLDMDGEPWLNPPSIGCDEYRAGALTGDLTVAIGASLTSVPVGVGVDFTAWISGRVANSAWDFGDGTVLSNRPYASHAWAAAADYPVVLRAYNEDHPEGVSATVTVRVVVQSVYYVSAASANPVPPYYSWTTAARTIQTAVDAAQAGATVLVTNGVYGTGGRAVFGTMTNRVAVTKAVVVQSVNGPAVTVIQGHRVPGTTNGDGAIRCAYLTNGAVLSGFTLTNGATRASGDSAQEQSGGGVWSESANAVVANCTLTGNSAIWTGGGASSGTLNYCILTGNSAQYGGGAFESSLYNCTLTGNSAQNGGGAAGGWLRNCALAGNSADQGGGIFSATINNCTLTGNSANQGGGAYYPTLYNCILYYNTANIGANYYNPFGNSMIISCCTTPLPGSGTGNISAEPKLASASHLSAASPCRGAGSGAFATDLDIDGEAWLNPPSMGCDEYHAGALTGDLTVALAASWTNVAPGVVVDFAASISGRVAASAWDFGDGTILSNRPYANHAWGAAGNYPVVLWAYNESHPEGVSAALTIRVVAQPVHYVRAASASPVPPYSSWATAARTIQDAVDAATVPGALVLVTNGVYATGGRAVFGLMTNRVAVTKAVVVRSVNGPAVTVIQGHQVPGTTNGDGAIRCVYLTNGAVLSGFMLTNGATRDWQGDWQHEQSGGGIWCESTNAVVTNCTLTASSAYSYGGGAYLGTLNNCTVTGNSADNSGGGTASATLNNCTLTANSASQYGGGASDSSLHNCTFTGNSAQYGGGASGGRLNNSTFTGNSAQYGGGTYNGTLNNCTLTGNSGSYEGGGAHSGMLCNCILYYNTAGSSSNHAGATLTNCCTTPLPGTGTGNISAEPKLASASHLSAGSPCRGAGSPAYATGLDIDGEPWLNPPSIGCDEYHGGAVTGDLTVALGASWTNVATGFAVDFTANISGRVTSSVWDFGDGTVLSNRPYASHAWRAAGDYRVVLWAYNESHPEGVSATVTIRVLEHPVYYVSAGSANPVPPYGSWETAAQTIQDAVDVAVPGGQVVVTNGLYASGGRAVYGLVTNRLAVTRPVVVQSVNGPEVTVIQGYQVPGTVNGEGAIRSVYLTNGATLSGFTLTNGGTVYGGDGGGVWCQSTSALITNCTLTGNSAYSRGGGAFNGTLNNCSLAGNSAPNGGGAAVGMLNNCILTGNSATSGGGTYGSTLNNCTLTGNSAYYGGGAFYGTMNNCTLTGNSASLGGGGGACYGTVNNCTFTGNSASLGGGAYGDQYNLLTLNNCTLTGNSASSDGGGAYFGKLNNCIVYYNSGGGNPNYSGCTLNSCCTTPLPGGPGNITAEPQLASASHLSAGSPCRGAGSAAYATGLDIDGEPWLNPPSIGCDEYRAGAVTGPLSVGIQATLTTVMPGYPVDLTAFIEGRTTASAWDFGDGTVLSNQPYASHAWGAVGDYAVVLHAYNASNPGGIAATVTVHVITQPIHYVAADNANPAPPYTSWETAATNIQDAVDAATVPGALVLVNNGTYAVGGRTGNRVAVDKLRELRSVNGPQFTVINGGGGVGCVYLTHDASLSGFTLTNGAGGVRCEPTAVVSNCVLSGNYGGGASGGTLNDCVLSGNFGGSGAVGSTLNHCTLTANSAHEGGGAYGSTLNNCTLTANSAYEGGGAYDSTLNNCTVSGNSVDDGGGGALYSTLNNCTLAGNSAASYGGGASGSTLNNCALTGNSANFAGGAAGSTLNNCTLAGNSAATSGGGVSGGTLTNCIVYYNTAPTDANYDEYSTLDHGCTTPAPATGAGNITDEPQLASASHLSAGSPCLGRGTYASVTGVDVDGEPWANPPAIGCDEYHSGSVTGALTVVLLPSYTNVAVGLIVEFQALISGQVSASRWEFGDGTVVSNRPYASHGFSAAGDYEVILRAYNESYPAGVTATVTVHVVTQPVHYVAADSLNPVVPYTSWETAATNIQNAVDAAAVPGALVLVNTGTYSTGEHVGNRVAVDKLLDLRSVHGPQLTVINGGGAVGCVYLIHGASLSGFTLTNGAGGVRCETTAVVSNCVLSGNSGSGASGGTLNNCVLSGNSGSGASGSTLNYCTVSGNFGGGASGSTLNNCTVTGNSSAGNGGGAYDSTLNNCTLTGNSATSGGGAYGSRLNNCALTGNSASYGGGAYGDQWHPCTLGNCVLTSNWATNSGGGAYQSTLINCTLSGNSADSGGGASYSTLSSCALTGNSATNSGGGALGCALTNCIVYYNAAPVSANCQSSSLNYCCTTPLPGAGLGNLDLEPQLASAFHLSANSPCLGRGTYAAVSGVDIDGEPWANPPAIGCDEYHSGAANGGLTVALLASSTNVATGFSVDFQALISGRVSASRWEFGDGTVVSNRPYASYAWSAAADYAVILRAYNESYPGGVTATVTVHVVTQPVHYVAAGNPTPVPPYTSWATAATSIQDAVDAAAVTGALVLVTNGVYQTGGRPVYGSMTNRVAVDKPLTVRSVSGPQFTIIMGYQVPGTTNGDGAIRCVYLTNGATLSGFTLTHGATRTNGDSHLEQSGGGLWCELPYAIVSNCVVAGNSAGRLGGGAYYGTLNNCTLTGNSAGSGGGASGSMLNNCQLAGNSAQDSGGGASGCTLNYCTLAGNSASASSPSGGGGGVSGCTLDNCTLISNSTTNYGGGALDSMLNNCTLTGNSAASGGGASGGALSHCTLTGNSATNYGGGASGGTLQNCTLAGNSADKGAGAAAGVLYNCTLTGNSAGYSGGGAYGSTLNHCTLTANTADYSGGGAYEGWLSNCTITDNSAYFAGGLFMDPGQADNCTITGNSAHWAGGAYAGVLNNCTLSGNWANWGGGAYYSTLNNCTLTGNSADYGGGAYYGTLSNSIVMFNTATVGANYWNSALNYCCTTPRPASGIGNNTREPLFADYARGDLRLQSNSPCINAGLNDYAFGPTDLDGRPRIVGGTVDIGAYEYQGTVAGDFIAWLAQHGLPTDGSADYADPDGDRLSNWQEWIAGTLPTEASSALRLLSPCNDVSGVIVTWQSVTNRTYFLERATNLGAAPVFSLLTSNLVGQAGTTTYTDTNAPGPGPFFYRVGVQQ